MGIPFIAASPISRAHPPLTGEGKAPDRPRNQGLPHVRVWVTQEVDLLGRTQPDKSPLGAPVPSEAAPDNRSSPVPLCKPEIFSLVCPMDDEPERGILVPSN
jgi:hypothetical protein